VAGSLTSFLISSMPLPRLGEKPVVDSARFLDLCQPHLAPAEFAALAAVALVPAGKPCCETQRRWDEFEIYLRNRIAEKRAATLKVEAQPHLRAERDVFPGWRRQIDDALAAPTPLARERALDRLRWQRLEDLVPGHEMDFDALVNYRLRLLLVEKEAGWQPEAGAERLAAAVKAAGAGAAGVRAAGHDAA
jgi:hypothetical protein